MTEVQDGYQRVAQGFGAAVDAASPNGWAAATPCEQWTARDVVAHVVEGHRRVLAGVTGGTPTPLSADEDPQAAWADASRALGDLTADPEAMAKEIDGPTGTMPAGQIITRFVTMDVLVHTWDLARAA